jgi:hypothetical protein
MVRVILGILKGGLVGAAVGFAATKVGLVAGPAAWLVYGLVGFLVGIVCGKAIWRHDTLVTPMLKGIFGFLLGLGLYWLAGKTLGGVHVPFATRLGAPDEPLSSLPLLLAPAIGIVYGIFVEVDDGERKKAAGEAPAPPKPPVGPA